MAAPPAVHLRAHLALYARRFAQPGSVAARSEAVVVLLDDGVRLHALGRAVLTVTPYSLLSRPSEFRCADRNPDPGDLAVVPFALAATAARPGETGAVYAHRCSGCVVRRGLRWDVVSLL